MSKTGKKLVESSSFSLIGVYINFIFGIVGTFFVARLITPDKWALLILTLSFVSLTTFFCNFFPPATDATIRYYIPTLIIEGEDSKNKIRGFIFHIYKIRLITTVPINILYLLITSLLFFGQELFTLILILSPIIFLNSITTLNGSILIAYQRFKLGFFMQIINGLIYTISLLTIFIFNLDNPLILIAYANLLIIIISFFLSFILIIPLIPSRKKDLKVSLNYRKEFIQIHKKYGIYLVLAGGIGQLTAILINCLFISFNVLTYITYFAICEKISSMVFRFSSSSESSNIPIFSELNNQADFQKFKTSFYYLIKYYSLFTCLLIGLIFCYIEIFVIIIYSETYLIIINAIQICLFTAFSRMFSRNLMVIANSTNNTKVIVFYNIIRMILLFIFLFIGLIFLDFFVVILFYVIVLFLLNYVLFLLINKATHLKLKFAILYRSFILFFISILITILLNYFINIQFFLDNYFLNLFINRSIKLGGFLLFFYLIVYFSRFVTKEEFNKLSKIIPILNLEKKFTQKVKKLIEKFLPSEKKLIDF